MSTLFEPTPQWYNVDLPAIEISKNDKLYTPEEATKKLKEARALLDDENEKSGISGHTSTGDRNFVNKILQSGTYSDKISAMTLLIQESPLHSLKSFESMLSMARKKSRNEALLAIQSLKDLFTGSVLPDRKLIYFADRPLGAANVEERHLILWAFEDYLKKYYFQVVEQLEALSHDTLMHIRYSSIRFMYDLLSGKPEQEQNLLRLVVNKLGDSENKAAAKASQLLIELMVAHPGMKLVVVQEIEQLLLRPSTSERSQYYCLITLNQTVLTGKNTDVANKLIEIYFLFFDRFLKLTDFKDKEPQDTETDKKDKNSKKNKNKKNKKQVQREKEAQHREELHVKMAEAILMGVNRAFHFAKISDEA